MLSHFLHLCLLQEQFATLKYTHMHTHTRTHTHICVGRDFEWRAWAGEKSLPAASWRAYTTKIDIYTVRECVRADLG